MKQIVIISDCNDVAYIEMYGSIKRLAKVPVDIAPLAPVKELSITNAAFIARLLCDSFAPGTIFLVLCSPNKERHERIVLETKSGHVFVAGNNGTLTLIAEELGVKQLRQYPRKGISTFGGRDAYCGVTAQLASESVEGIGTHLAIEQLVRLPIAEHTVLHIDNFGLIKMRCKEHIEEGVRYHILHNGRSIGEAVGSKRFMDLDTGILTIYNGSSFGYVEIARVRKNLALELGAQVGDSITFTRA